MQLNNKIIQDTGIDKYNNCFVLSGICKKCGKKIKQCYFIQDGKAIVLWTKGNPGNEIYRQLTYDVARQTLDNYFENGTPRRF